MHNLPAVIPMEAHVKGQDILVVDLETIPCPTGQCRRLEHLIHQSVPFNERRPLLETRLPLGPGSAPPALLLVRMTRFSESLHSFRQMWPQVALLGVFCAGWEPADIVEPFLND